MYEIGSRDEVVGAGNLTPIKQMRRFEHCIGGNTPLAFPEVGEGQTVICGLIRYPGQPEQLFLCENLADMNRCYQSYYSGAWSTINWYIGPVLVVLRANPGDSKPES